MGEISHAYHLIMNLQDFIRNKTLFSTSEEKFDTVNKVRQKFLYNQEYLSLLGNILGNLFTKLELDIILANEDEAWTKSESRKRS